MLTPQDVRSVQFEKNLRGYRTEDVDRFLEPLHLPEFLAQQFRRKNAQREEAERHQIVQHGPPVAFDQLHAAQHDVAGLSVGENFAAI